MNQHKKMFSLLFLLIAALFVMRSSPLSLSLAVPLLGIIIILRWLNNTNTQNLLLFLKHKNIYLAFFWISSALLCASLPIADYLNNIQLTAVIVYIPLIWVLGFDEKISVRIAAAFLLFSLFFMLNNQAEIAETYGNIAFYFFTIATFQAVITYTSYEYDKS